MFLEWETVTNTFAAPNEKPMKNFVLILQVALLFFMSASVMGQEEAVDGQWKTGSNLLVNFNQVSLKNWAAGGVPSISLLGRTEGFADYLKGVHAWKNDFLLSYGIQKIKQNPSEKSEDIIRLTSTYMRTLSSKWKLTGAGSFTTQLTPTRDKDSVVVSRFLAPAYALLSVGFTWTPAPKLEALFSPATGKLTIVNDPALSARGAYGVDSGATVRSEFGALVRVTYERDLIKNVNWKTRLELFNNFTDPNRSNRKNVDMDWQNSFFLKVNKWLSASVMFHTIYDADIPIAIDDNEDGVTDRYGPRLQWKEILGVGFSYQLGAKR